MSGSGDAVANTEQAEFWDGVEGDHWVRHQERYDGLTGAFTDALLAAAAIGETDWVLDIGCGNGQTTRLAARGAPRGTALGLDLSTAMLERARGDAVAEGVTNVTFERGDAQVHPFAPGGFDVAVSRFGVMFFDDPAAAFANIGHALRSGGRLAFVCWQDALSNEYITVPAGALLEHVPLPDLGGPDAPGAFSLVDPDRITSVLTKAGFDEVTVSPVVTPMRLGGDADDAVAFIADNDIARKFLDPVDPETAARALDAVRATLRAHERPEGLFLNGAAWLVTARRP
jgi:SAM-dependent methyltransferase